MRTPTLVTFLNAALKLQAPPYEGVRVVNDTMLATDGYRMVVYKPAVGFTQGDGVIEPVNAKVLLAYATETYVTQIRVNGGAIEFDVAFGSIDAPNGYAQKSDTVRLAAFDARNMRPENVLPRLQPPAARLAASGLSVKKLREFDAQNDEKVVFDGQFAAFRLEDISLYRYSYSARQVRDALSAFSARENVNVWIGGNNELVIGTEHFFYAMCSFVHRGKVKE